MKFFVAAFAGGVAVLASASASAQTGNWYGTVSAPVIRQTNTDYNSGNINPQAQPSGTVITSTSWYATYSGAPAGMSFKITHCRTSGSICAPLSGFNSGSTNFHAGVGSLQPFFFRVRVNSTSTQVLSSSMVSTPLQLTVNYSY
ncbi:hypothetical protein [Brevundimonas sp.]|uniref:hypothetical protein n=1 Tax=Brevundimonas sp. TaxID=1871086 RepID=UPI003D6D3E75